MSNPFYTMLIGLPASGKSTHRKLIEDENKYNHYDYYVYSSDDLIVNYAESIGKTYNDVFQDYIKEATSISESLLDDAFSKNKDIIDDHTNLSIKTRKKKLQKIPSHYVKSAIILLTPDHDEWNRRLSNRPGKTIPKHVLESMVNSFSIPTHDEGFDNIICWGKNE